MLAERLPPTWFLQQEFMFTSRPAPLCLLQMNPQTRVLIKKQLVQKLLREPLPLVPVSNYSLKLFPEQSSTEQVSLKSLIVKPASPPAPLHHHHHHHHHLCYCGCSRLDYCSLREDYPDAVRLEACAAAGDQPEGRRRNDGFKSAERRFGRLHGTDGGDRNKREM